MAKRTDPSPSKSRPSTRRSPRSTTDAPGGSAAAPSPAENPAHAHSEEVAPLAKSDEELPDDFQAIFGQNVRKARLKSGLKQSEVAERTGLSQQRLSQIENGQQNVTLRTMVKLAQVVDHNISSLLMKVAARRKKDGTPN